jgi:putative transposase
MSALQKYKTCKRWNEPGDAHFLTFTCFHGYKLLSRDRTRLWLVEAVDRARRRHAFDVWAYVVMPEHVHLVIRPRNRDYDISPMLKAMKWPVSTRARKFLERTSPEWVRRLTVVQPNGQQCFRFWQRGGGFARNVRHERSVGAMIEYIHANPVRRGLAREPVDWIWSSARWYEGQRDVPLLMDDTLV